MNTLLKDNNYIYIPNFISEIRAKAMASNFKQHCIDNNKHGDNQAPNSHSEYNFIDFLELLCERTSVISEITGETVLPTYSYARVYKNGSVLERHRDRDACEVSMTIHLDGDKEWPIYIETPDHGEVELNLKSGDAMLYLGCEADHWRNRFEGEEYVQTFLHYVLSRGDRAYTYFDKEKINENCKKQTEFKNNSAKIETVTEKPHKINTENKKSLDDYIIVLNNVLPDDLCDDILEEYNTSDIWHMASVGYQSMDLSIRNVNTIGISQENVINQNYEIRKVLDDKIFKCTNFAINKYNEYFPHCSIIEDSGYELLKYETGQFYKEHTDSYNIHPRAVSCSFALNDNFEGGEFAFFDRELKYKLKKGSAILFPSNFMYPHEIMPVTKGTRYSIITWFI
jgi:hypothetical protein